MTRPDHITADQVREVVQGILVGRRRQHCRCGGEIEIRLQHRTPTPNPVTPVLRKMGIKELRFGPKSWYEVSDLVCTQCHSRLGPFEEIHSLNACLGLGMLKPARVAYTDSKGRSQTRSLRLPSWKKRVKNTFDPKVGEFHRQVQTFLRQNLRTCTHCGGRIDYRWESRLGEVQTIYRDVPPGTVGFKTPPDPEWYDVVVSVFCQKCRTLFEIPQEIEQLNREVAMGAQRIHFALRSRGSKEDRHPGAGWPKLPEGGEPRLVDMDNLGCTCETDHCLKHTRIKAGV